MNNKEFFIETLKDELPRFERVFKAIEAVPKNKHGHKHDPKSRTASELAGTIGAESGMIVTFLKTGKLDMLAVISPKWETVADIRKYFAKSMKTVLDTSSKMDQKKWNSKAKMSMGEKSEWESPRGKMAWAFLLDLIHHRGQLSTYIRPMGGKVPSIYGPSADSK
ncbi:hypothetical protein H0W91_03915 [Patescibacteria group bacterium]|nr:hypothetical protein [Patescibacteria group bacterium]